VIANTTFILNSVSRESRADEDTDILNRIFDAYVNSNSLMQFGNTTNILIIRGEELHDKRIKIDFRSKSGQNQAFMKLCKNSI
jgi:hypothetical protein